MVREWGTPHTLPTIASWDSFCQPKRHNAILHSLADLLKKNRMEVTLDKKFHESTLRPGLVTKARGTTYIIDVVVVTTTPHLIWRKSTRENEISMIA